MAESLVKPELFDAITHYLIDIYGEKCYFVLCRTNVKLIKDEFEESTYNNRSGMENNMDPDLMEPNAGTAKIKAAESDKGEKLILQQIESWYTQWLLVERLYMEFAKRFDLTSSALFVLRTMLENPKGCTQRYICETFSYPKQSVSSIIQVLVGKGLAVKRQSMEDKRNVELFLTEAGIVFTSHMAEELKLAEEKAFSTLLPEDREKFTQINEVLTSALHTAMDIEIP